MRVAYIGDFINHGRSLHTTGTPLVILLSSRETVDSIDVYCPRVNNKVENFKPPKNVRIIEFYKYDDSISLLRLLKISWNTYDTIIFNMLPTGFGDSSLANAVALMIPILLKKLFRQNNIKVIYHNSVFTNDVKKLGYGSKMDKVRSFFLSIIERSIFKNITTFVLLKLYKQRIDDAIGKNRVQVLNTRYLEAITTLYMNMAMNIDAIEVKQPEIPTILMHGTWGPQKNIEIGLSALKDLIDSGEKLNVVISGGLNHHFPEYGTKFQALLYTFSDIIDKYIGSIDEIDIMNLFLKANLLILPYNTPGGHSGVLEQAIFFEVPTIAIDFPEYREQASSSKFVSLVSQQELSNAIRDRIRHSSSGTRKITIEKKIKLAQSLICETLHNI